MDYFREFDRILDSSAKKREEMNKDKRTVKSSLISSSRTIKDDNKSKRTVKSLVSSYIRSEKPDAKKAIKALVSSQRKTGTTVSYEDFVRKYSRKSLGSSLLSNHRFNKRRAIRSLLSSTNGDSKVLRAIWRFIRDQFESYEYEEGEWNLLTSSGISPESFATEIDEDTAYNNVSVEIVSSPRANSSNRGKLKITVDSEDPEDIKTIANSVKENLTGYLFSDNEGSGETSEDFVFEINDFMESYYSENYTFDSDEYTVLSFNVKSKVTGLKITEKDILVNFTLTVENIDIKSNEEDDDEW